MDQLLCRYGSRQSNRRANAGRSSSAIGGIAEEYGLAVDGAGRITEVNRLGLDLERNIDRGIYDYFQRFATAFALDGEDLKARYSAKRWEGEKPTTAALSVLAAVRAKVPASKRGPAFHRALDSGFDPLFRYGLGFDEEIRELEEKIARLFHSKSPEDDVT
jgi:hypothetical protein